MLVDLEMAKRNLKLDDDSADDTLVEIIRDASEIMLDYLKISQDSYSGTDGNLTDVPLRVRRATLLVIKNLFDHPDKDPIDEAVRSILMRSRDPAIA